MPGFKYVADVDQIPDDGGFVVSLDGREVVIFCCAGEYYAVENSCPHRGGPIAEGEFEQGIVSCPWHAWTFDVRSGECTINRAARLETFEVRVQDGRIEVGPGSTP